MCICVIWYTQIMEYFDERCSQKFICARMLILQKREKDKKYTRKGTFLRGVYEIPSQRREGKAKRRVNRILRRRQLSSRHVIFSRLVYSPNVFPRYSTRHDD